MLSVQITDIHSTKVATEQLPLSWSELHLLLRADRMMYQSIVPILLSMDDTLIRTAIVRYYLSRYTRVSAFDYELAVSQAIAVMDQISMTHLYDYSEPICPRITIGLFTPLACYRTTMEDATMREFIIADETLQTYLAEPTERRLFELVACMYRPVKAGKRIPLTDREQITPIADIIQRYSRSYMRKTITYACASALYQILHTKQHIDKVYMPHLSGDGEGTQVPGMHFGWYNIVMDVAETGVFGDMESTYSSPVHDILIFLLKKKQDHITATTKT